MSGFFGFVGDPKVHDTVLVTMAISSFILALPKPKPVSEKWYDVAYKFAYDWLTGFWSMRTGQKSPDHPTSPVTPAKP